MRGYTKYPVGTIIQEGDMVMCSDGLQPLFASCVGERSVNEIYRLEKYIELQKE